jgi:hypothetical protein
MEDDPAKGFNSIITLRRRWLWAMLFGQELQFSGQCTVWHILPDCHRAGTVMEGYLCSIETREKRKQA